MTRPVALAAAGTILLAAALVEAAPANVAVAGVNPVLNGARTVFSSSVLMVSWTPDPADQTDHFEIVAAEGVQGTSVRVSVAATATTTAITNLKAQTQYQIVVMSCADEACTVSTAAEAVTGATDTEYWRLRGTGNNVTGLTAAVSDGNAKLSATRFGPDAGPNANRIQLYYGPMRQQGREGSLSVAVASGPANPAVPNSFLTFTSRANTTGLITPTSPAPLVAEVATGQGVPVSTPTGGFVRLFFEAQGADNRTRAMWVDSTDGFLGLDFNRGAATTCSTTADYSTGGGCAPTVAFGVDGDVGGNRGITNARQVKVAWPTLDSPHWDMAPGTFMVFTLDRMDRCNAPAFAQHGYAVWDGTTWTVQYRADGCPKMFTSAQAAFPFHSGGARYRLYYGDPSLTAGKVAGSSLPFLGPKKLIYADGVLTGLPAVVDFEDWEPQTSSRDIVFLWPNGDQMDAAAEGYIDDYHFLTPTGTNSLQVMYLTITDGAVAPFSAVAILTNP